MPGAEPRQQTEAGTAVAPKVAPPLAAQPRRFAPVKGSSIFIPTVHLDEKDQRQWVTVIQAIDPRTGKITRFMGPIVPGRSKQEAQAYCNQNGMAYALVDSMIKTTVLELTPHQYLN